MLKLLSYNIKGTILRALKIYCKLLPQNNYCKSSLNIDLLKIYIFKDPKIQITKWRSYNKQSMFLHIFMAKNINFNANS